MRIILLLLALCCFAAPAHAMRVRNADATPYHLTLRYLQDSWNIILEPGEHISRYQPGIVLQLEQQDPINTKADEEYMIQNGKLILNKRNCCGMRHK